MWIGRYALTLLCAVIISPTLAFASNNNTSNQELLDTLYNNHGITKEQYQQLKQKNRHGKHKRKNLPHLVGYMQLDAPLSVSHGDFLGSSTLLRRLYLGVYGKIGSSWKYKAKFGFVSGKAGVSTAVLSYLGFKPASITLGYMKEPFSLNYMTSPTQLAFTERALPIGLVPGKKIGLLFGSHGRHWTVAGGIFGAKYNNVPRGNPGGKAGQARYGESLRATFTPIITKNIVWEIGASGAWRDADSAHTYKFKTRPEEYTVGATLAATGTIGNVQSVTSYGAETSLCTGPISLQGEYIGTRLNRDADSRDLTFDGWYTQVTLSLNGSARRFVPSKGKVVGVKPTSSVGSGGLGALELALRYSTVNLNDIDINGGKQRDITFGVNWYPESRIRISLDDTRVLPLQGGKYDGVSSNIIEARAQVVL
jgi:phosphate-selective porin OprO/OprP